MPKIERDEDEDEILAEGAEGEGEGEGEGEEGDLPENEEDSEAAQKAAEEAKARRAGWIPEDEWDDEKAAKKGIRKPARFKTAAEFLRDAENNPAMQRERARHADKTIERLERKLDLMGKVLGDQRRMAAEAQQRAYEKGLAEAKARKREAIADGDVEKVEKIEKEIDDLTDQIDEAKAVIGEEDGDEGEDTARRRDPKREKRTAPNGGDSGNPEVDAWIERNKWFSTDPVRKAFMVDAHAKLCRENPGVDEAEFLEEAKQLTRDRFPERFGGNPARRAPPATRSAPGGRDGDEGGTRAPRGRTWADVPARDKAAYERTRQMIESTRKGEKYTREDFLKEYQWN